MRRNRYMGTGATVSDLFAQHGLAGLEDLPGVGTSIARSIRDLLLHGRLAMLDRLRGNMMQFSAAS